MELQEKMLLGIGRSGCQLNFCVGFSLCPLRLSTDLFYSAIMLNFNDMKDIEDFTFFLLSCTAVKMLL